MLEMSEIDKLLTEYEQMIGGSVKSTGGRKRMSDSIMEPPAVPMSKAAKKKAEDVAKKVTKPIGGAVTKKTELAAKINKPKNAVANTAEDKVKSATKPVTTAAIKKAKLATENVDKPKSTAAQRKADASIAQKFEKLLVKSRAPPRAESPNKQEKARIRYAQKKLLAEQNRAEHEAFLLEAFNLAETTTSTRSSANSKKIRAMLNSLFGSKDCGEYVPPSTVDITGMGIYARSSRRLRKDNPDADDSVPISSTEVPVVVPTNSDAGDMQPADVIIPDIPTDHTVTKEVPKRTLPTKTGMRKRAKKIIIKVKIESRALPLMVEVEKTQPMKLAYIKLSEELNCKVEKIRLRFEGEKVEWDSTPEELYFEGGEELNCRVVR